MDFFSYQVTGVVLLRNGDLVLLFIYFFYFILIKICADGERISMKRGERRKDEEERRKERGERIEEAAEKLIKIFYLAFIHLST